MAEIRVDICLAGMDNVATGSSQTADLNVLSAVFIWQFQVVSGNCKRALLMVLLMVSICESTFLAFGTINGDAQ